MLRKYGPCGMLSSVFVIIGCGGDPGSADGEIVDVEPVGEVAEALVFGTFKLGAYDQGWWHLDTNVNGVPDDPTRGPFGDTTDIPLVGYGSNLDCGFAGGHFGTYRPSTDQYFFDANGNTTWDAADWYFNGYNAGLIREFPQNQLHPIIWTKKVGARCQGVIGSVSVFNDGMTLWTVDLNADHKLNPPGDEVYAFKPPGTDHNNYPAPIWSATHNTTVMAVFNRATGTWYVDKNNNKTFDNCALDSCTTFGNPWALPMSHPNSSRRGVSQFAFSAAGNGFWKAIDGNANGLWDGAPADDAFPYYINAPRGFIW